MKSGFNIFIVVALLSLISLQAFVVIQNQRMLDEEGIDPDVAERLFKSSNDQISNLIATLKAASDGFQNHQENELIQLERNLTEIVDSHLVKIDLLNDQSADLLDSLLSNAQSGNQVIENLVVTLDDLLKTMGEKINEYPLEKTQFEYKGVYTVRDYDTINTLERDFNSLGKQGWKFGGYAMNDGTNGRVVMFYRPKE